MPIGTIYGIKNEFDSDENSMFLVPRRILYEIDERFMRYEDFQLFLVDKGVVKDVKTNSPGISVTLSGDENLSSEFNESVTTSHFQFFRVGRHKVTVEFSGRKADYSLQVTSPSNGAGLGGDGGIGIIWLE